MNEAQILALINEKILSGGRLTTAESLREVLSAINAAIFANGNQPLKVIIVDAVHGDNAEATIYQKPFHTINAAKESASEGDLIIVLPGTYSETINSSVGGSLLKNGVNYYFHKGVSITTTVNTPLFNDDNAAITAAIYGAADFIISSAPLVLKTRNASSKIHFECNEISGGGGTNISFDLGGGNINLVAHKIANNGSGLVLANAVTLTAKIREIYMTSIISTASAINATSFTGTAIINCELINITTYQIAEGIRLGTANTGTIYLNATKVYGQPIAAISVQSGILFFEGNVITKYAALVTKGAGTATVRAKGYFESTESMAILIGGGSSIKCFVDGTVKALIDTAISMGYNEITGMTSTGNHLDLNGAVYSDTGDGIRKAGTSNYMILNSVKIICAGISITSGDAQTVTVIHGARANTDKGADITINGTGTFSFSAVIS